ncbi:MAG: class I SAM-dependent methyltransferase [Pseudomonadales bacterium]|jgi:2-polyprenyl-3-methyl-5-hydroxy-6-metoxy-1,4-benzoquinol methylase|nr:class I SAM-dependent methyltransferase [Pseudomonadales bacterium]
MKNPQKHHYEYEVDTQSASAPASVVRLVGTHKRVLEIGCGPGSITRVLATQGQCSVVGMELDADAIEKVAPFCEKVLQIDLNAQDWPRLLDNEPRFDVVVAADVLEHLYDPWRTLRQMAPLLNENGYMVVSLPHTGHAGVMACLMNSDFAYNGWGLLDRTHIRFFGVKNIEALFAQADLKIIEVIHVIVPPQETDFAVQWVKLPEATRAVLQTSPYANLYQVVVKAVPLTREGAAVSLILEQKPQVTPSWKSRLGARLSPKSKALLRKVLGAAGIKL